MHRDRSIYEKFIRPIIRWLDADSGMDTPDPGPEKAVDWFRIAPFILLHAGCLGVFWVGWSWTAVGTAVFLYVIRMFAITGFYHRYFSHKAFKTSRFWQFLFAAIGNASAQRGPLWWVAHHRHHHRFTDQAEDVHSPIVHGFWWSHMGWLTSRSNFVTKTRYVRDWARFPELNWLNRFDIAAPLALACLLWVTGWLLGRHAPGIGTSGMQMVVWGFFVSTTALFHGTVSINSFAHMYGTRRYNTPDTSRNNLLLSIVTLGEGWHNNHHQYPVTARQGFFWWEIDVTFYLLVLMARLGIVRDLRPLPTDVLTRNRLPES